MTPCKLTAGFCVAQVDCQTPDGKTAFYCLEKQTTCPYRQAASDFDTLLAMLTKTGERIRYWDVREFITKDDVLVKAKGIVLVQGSEVDGPFTEYLFDRKGNILPGGDAGARVE